MFKAEADGQPPASGSLVHQTQQSLGPGGRRLKAVDSGADDLFGEDDEDNGAAKRRAKEFGGEGDMDEMVYEEDFADDEEKMDVEDTNDQEAKELEVRCLNQTIIKLNSIDFFQERLKKEYKNANKTREGYIDESDEEEEKPGMTKQAKRMQKMLRAREGNDVYESEEEEDNPYASSVSTITFSLRSALTAIDLCKGRRGRGGGRNCSSNWSCSSAPVQIPDTVTNFQPQSRVSESYYSNQWYCTHDRIPCYIPRSRSWGTFCCRETRY